MKRILIVGAFLLGFAFDQYSHAQSVQTNPSATGIPTSGGGGGSGSVTSVSVQSANGLAGTVANATTTPAITLSTSVTGIAQGNGTGLSAVAGSSVSSNGSLTLGGATVTASDPVISASQTWNNAGVAFTGALYNYAVTSSNNSGFLVRWQRNGSNVAWIDEFGDATFDAVKSGSPTQTWMYANSNGLALPSNLGLSFTSASNNAGGAKDTSLSRSAAATVAVGNGTAGDASGTLKAAAVSVTGDINMTSGHLNSTGGYISQGTGAVIYQGSFGTQLFGTQNKAVTNNVATGFIKFTPGTDAGMVGMVVYYVTVKDATHGVQVSTGTIPFGCVNSNGTLSATTPSAVNTIQRLSTGTDAISFTTTTDTTSCTLLVTSNTSLTATSHNINAEFIGSGSGAIVGL